MYLCPNCFVVWPWSLSTKCFRHAIVKLRYKSIFMTLYKSTDIEIIKYCQNIFELPSVRLSRLKTRFLASYSSVNNLVCRHILIYGWSLCFCWYTSSIVLFCYVCLFIFVFILPDLWWIKLFNCHRVSVVYLQEIGVRKRQQSSQQCRKFTGGKCTKSVRSV